jgi:positive regulator of sigma E activity
MREIGKIVSIEREKLSLVLETGTGCSSCDVVDKPDTAMGCHACSLFGSKKMKTVDAVNRSNLPLKVGDLVVIYLDPKKTIFAAFLLFIFPLLAFLACYAAATLFAPAPAESVKILVGAAGFAGAYLLLFLRRMFRKMKDWPEVVEKFDPQRDGR